MAKRSIDGYKPKGIDLETRYASVALLDRLVEIAGPLPDRPFVIEAVGPTPQEKWIEQKVPARGYLKYWLEIAATAYHYESAALRKPTARQLAVAFADIERAAKALLQQLQVTGKDGPNIDNMPHALRHGSLRDEAWKDALRRMKSRPGGFCSADTLMREAVQGVEAIRRWAATAKSSEKCQLGEGAVPTSKFEGDKALNEYLRTVVLHCWQSACGQELAVGPRLLRFLRVATGSIKRRLPDDAALEKRIRRIVEEQPAPS